CSCLQSFTPNTKCLLSDVLSMLTGFLPHGDVGRYYLFLRSRYRQFFRNMENSDDKKGSSISPRCRKGDNSKKSTDEGTAESFELQTNAMQHLARTSKGGHRLRQQPTPSAINPDQHLWNPQDCLNKTSHLQPSKTINTYQLQGSTATPETIAHPHPRTLTQQHIRKLPN